ncbi:hypothetical protein ABZX92_11560 [Lentzea sp. NPDC006480]|uniref:hypothetical protein n=1 Tax=Lentzea sp. NPDC006480 TaxID=3157176 RepID=UPI0033ADC48B
MSETPTHAAVPTPAATRPQQTERQGEGRAEDRTPSTDRMPQQSQRTDLRTDQRAEQRAEQRSDQRGAERAEQRADQRGADRAEQRDEQRNEQREERRGEERSEQRPEHQRVDQQRTEAQRPSSKLEDEWKAVQYEFVDDPKAAVRKADDLVKRAIEELTTRHRSLAKQLEGNGDQQTEDLRLALHRYRELFKSLVAAK